MDDAPAAPLSAADFRETLRLFAYVRPYSCKFAAAQVCLLVSTLAGLGFPFLTGRLIDSAYRGAGKASNGFLWTTTAPDANAVAVLLLVTIALQASCSAFQTYWLAEVGERSLAAFRRDVYSHLIRLPMEFFGRRRVGELGSRLANDLDVIHRILTGAVPALVGQLIVLGGALSLIAMTSGRLTLVMLSTLPVSIGLAVVLGKRTRKLSRETLDKLAATNVIVEETLQGIACVKSFANEGYETSRYQQGIASQNAVVLRGARYQGFFGGFITFTLFGSTVPTIWYGSRLVEAGLLTFGGMTQFLLYTTYIGGSLGQFARLYGEWHRASVRPSVCGNCWRNRPRRSGWRKQTPPVSARPCPCRLHVSPERSRSRK